MRIAAISHSCTIDVNQRVFAELLRHPEVELLLIAPRRWTSPLRGVVTYTALPELQNVSVALPTRLTGHIHFHWYRGLGPVLQRFAPDLIYVDEEPYSVVTSQALAWRNRLDCRFVFYTKQNLLRRYPLPFHYMQQRVLAAADHAMVVSPGAAQVLRRRGFQGGMTELPHGIDLEPPPSPEVIEDLRQRLGVQGQVVGYVGRLAPEKGVWDLLEAVRILVARRGPSFTVLMIGDGPARWKLQDAAAGILPPGLMIFTGGVAHHAIPQYLSALDVLVLPSRTLRRWKEQFGRVLVEAMACGVPCVGSDSGHIPALIEATGGGLVCREADPVDLADKIESLIADPDRAARIGQTGRRAVAERYAYPRVAAILYETLRQVLQG